MQGLTLRPADTGLVLVDIQERLAAAMPQPHLDRAIRNWTMLAEMAARLKLPIAVSEQYPQGLGRTLPLLREILGKVTPPPRFVEKLEFACTEVPLFEQYVLDSGRRNWLVAGMETHICVYQTVRGLVQRKCDVHVLSDAVVSRRKADWRVGLSLATRAGAIVTSTETALFDLVHAARGEHFKVLAKLVK